MVFGSSGSPSSSSASGSPSPESAAEGLVGFLDGVSLLRRAGASGHMERVVREMHESTLFTVQDGVEVVATLCGSRPGDPFGDFIFAFSMAAQLERATERMRSEGLLGTTPWDGARSLALPDAGAPFTEGELSEASYADDVTSLLTDRCPRALVEKTARAAGLLAHTFLAHACLINPEPGKTEVILCFRGRGTQAGRQEVFLEHGGMLGCNGGHAGQLRITVSFQYKHMGGIVDATGSMRYELKARADCAAAAGRPLRRRVIENSALTRDARVMLVGRALVASRLHTNAQAWMPLDADSRSRHQIAMLAMYRRVTGFTGDAEKHFSDAAALAEGLFAEPQEAITVARLRFLTRLLARAPDALFALLRSGRPGPGSWVGALDGDFCWLRQFGRDSPCPADEPAVRAEQAAAVAVAAPKQWLALVRQAAASAQRRRRNHQEAANGLRACAAALGGGLPSSDGTAQPLGDAAAPAPRPAAPALPMLPCPECGHLFEGLRALGPHRYRVHSMRRFVRDYVDGAVCGACFMEFHSRRRFIHRLKFSGTQCLQLLAATRDPLPPETSNALDRAESARCRELRKKGCFDRLQRLPAVRIPGPLPPPAAEQPAAAAGPEAVADAPHADLPDDELPTPSSSCCFATRLMRRTPPACARPMASFQPSAPSPTRSPSCCTSARGDDAMATSSASSATLPAGCRASTSSSSASMSPSIPSAATSPAWTPCASGRTRPLRTGSSASSGVPRAKLGLGFGVRGSPVCPMPKSPRCSALLPSRGGSRACDFGTASSSASPPSSSRPSSSSSRSCCAPAASRSSSIPRSPGSWTRFPSGDCRSFVNSPSSLASSATTSARARSASFRSSPPRSSCCACPRCCCASASVLHRATSPPRAAWASRRTVLGHRLAQGVPARDVRGHRGRHRRHPHRACAASRMRCRRCRRHRELPRLGLPLGPLPRRRRLRHARRLRRRGRCCSALSAPALE